MTLKHSPQRMKLVIVNGSPVSPGAVPYIVSIKLPHGFGIYKNMCGGSIISACKVLTAAHCFEKDKFYYKKHPQSIRVVAGNLSNALLLSQEATSPNTQWRNVTTIKTHPDFHFPVHDIAILKVTPPWEFSRFVGKIAIAPKRGKWGPCFTSGYGRVGYSKTAQHSPVLLRAKTAVMSRSQCSRVWGLRMDNFVCSYSYASDVTSGDSGGPLACRSRNRKAKTEDLLIGIVIGKNYDKTSLYTRVSAYWDFIENDDGPNSSGCVCLCNMLLIFLVQISLWL